MADPEGCGFRGFALSVPPFFKYPMKIKSLGLIEAKLFHFHWIFRINETKSAKRTPNPFIHNGTPFLKSWIRPWVWLPPIRCNKFQPYLYNSYAKTFCLLLNEKLKYNYKVSISKQAQITPEYRKQNHYHD